MVVNSNNWLTIDGKSIIIGYKNLKYFLNNEKINLLCETLSNNKNLTYIRFCDYIKFKNITDILLLSSVIQTTKLKIVDLGRSINNINNENFYNSIKNNINIKCINIYQKYYMYEKFFYIKHIKEIHTTINNINELKILKNILKNRGYKDKCIYISF